MEDDKGSGRGQWLGPDEGASMHCSALEQERACGVPRGGPGAANSGESARWWRSVCQRKR
jgi:hypothetical protein